LFTVTARNVTGLVDALQRDGVVERLPHPTTAGPPWSGSPQQGNASAASCWPSSGPPWPTCWLSSPETTSATCYRYWSHCAPCWPEPPTVPGWPRQNLEKGQSVDGLRIDRRSGDELVDRGAEPLGLASSLRPRQLAGEAPAYELLSRALVLAWSARW
jgi:hypothetical protein